MNGQNKWFGWFGWSVPAQVLKSGRYISEKYGGMNPPKPLKPLPAGGGR